MSQPQPKEEYRGHPRFYELLDEMKKLHDMKSSDYSKDADPFSNFRLAENIGIPAWISIVIRLTDKLSRIMQLTRKTLEGREASVKSETIKDTLLDTSIYSLLCIMLYEEWVKEGKVIELSRKSEIAIKMITEMNRMLDSIGIPK
jgi:hypothetical protein